MEHGTDVITELVHACPPAGSGLMPCCGRTPFEVPRTDRMTLDSALVTCGPRIELLSFACTRCGADVGELCRTASGARSYDAHAARYEAEGAYFAAPCGFPGHDHARTYCETLGDAAREQRRRECATAGFC